MAKPWDNLTSFEKSEVCYEITGNFSFNTKEEVALKRVYSTCNKLAEIRKTQYKLYLQSDAWLERRWRILQRDDCACRVCGARDDLHVHHLTYDRKYNESDYDLITVCKKCHEIIHDLN